MFRALFKLIILLVVLMLAAGFFLGWWGASDTTRERENIEAAGRTAAERAKIAGAQISEKTAQATAQAKDALEDGALTAKIKAKMALDDKVKASNINVNTSNRVVTVSGTVASAAERDRALLLARETDGVREVLDRTVVK